MLAIAGAFGLLVGTSGRQPYEHGGTAPQPISYVWGVGSSLAYAFAYIARKYGLININAPIFGTMISAVSGFAFFALAAVFVNSYRRNLLNIFTGLNRWLVYAAFSVSISQILQFAALSYEKVSTVVMINSLEIFISTFLSVVVFRAERRPGAGILAAACFATAGVITIALG
jgi:drug/metabolite transporter (DMT)-like permease